MDEKYVDIKQSTLAQVSWPFRQICPFRMKRLEYFKKIKIACRLRVDSFQLGATILSWVSDGIWESNELIIKLI